MRSRFGFGVLLATLVLVTAGLSQCPSKNSWLEKTMKHVFTDTSFPDANNGWVCHPEMGRKT